MKQLQQNALCYLEKKVWKLKSKLGRRGVFQTCKDKTYYHEQIVT